MATQREAVDLEEEEYVKKCIGYVSARYQKV
jgi:hypothetical protein